MNITTHEYLVIFNSGNPQDWHKLNTKQKRTRWPNARLNQNVVEFWLKIKKWLEVPIRATTISSPNRFTLLTKKEITSIPPTVKTKYDDVDYFKTFYCGFFITKLCFSLLNASLL